MQEDESLYLSQNINQTAFKMELGRTREITILRGSSRTNSTVQNALPTPWDVTGPSKAINNGLNKVTNSSDPPIACHSPSDENAGHRPRSSEEANGEDVVEIINTTLGTKIATFLLKEKSISFLRVWVSHMAFRRAEDRWQSALTSWLTHPHEADFFLNRSAR